MPYYIPWWILDIKKYDPPGRPKRWFMQETRTPLQGINHILFFKIEFQTRIYDISLIVCFPSIRKLLTSMTVSEQFFSTKNGKSSLRYW